jgi:hypothetical protein
MTAINMPARILKGRKSFHMISDNYVGPRITGIARVKRTTHSLRKFLSTRLRQDAPCSSTGRNGDRRPRRTP